MTKYHLLTITILIIASFSLANVSFAFTSIVPEACRGEAEIGEGPDKCGLDAVEIGAVNVATVILSIAGSLALLMFVIGGFMYIFAGGNQNLTTKAKNFLVYAVIGLVIVLSSGLILKSVVQALGG
jgi:hypothetical protein